MSAVSRTIVTGANGLLGSHLVPLLAESGEVFAASRTAASAGPGVTPLALDLSAPIDMTALPASVDTIIYLAQSSRFREFPDAADDIFQVNTAQLLAMLDYGRRAGARNFVYASTGGVYGTTEEVLTEESPTPPPGQTLGFYPASKLAGEILAKTYAPYMNVVILRYFFIYGAGQKRDMLVPRLVDSVRDGRPVTIQGQSGLRINPVHAADAADATAAAARLDRSATINVAGPETLSLRAMCDAIGRKLNKEPVYQVQADQEATSLVADTKAMSELLVPPSRRFADGVADLI
jgi:nucleoside-diphosphate-sugar epimerase